MTIDNKSLLSPSCVDATYTPQRIPQFKANPLIEALPPPMSDEELFSSLTLLPDFNIEQRMWSSHERMFMLKSLQNFMVPLSKHIELTRALDSLLRAGYVGREPNTAEHTKIFQKIYENQKKGIAFKQSCNTQCSQLSTALIGLSGMGKTTTVKRWFAHIPKVIYHKEMNLYQVPYLHIEMPSDGSSIKGLAQAILLKMDELIPGANYYDEYNANGRAGSDSLMRSVARVMNMHCVGILVCDEVQNLDNAKKGGQTLMTELVSACNDLHVPILFIGTNKAAKILSLDFRQSRRSSGHGITPWNRFLQSGSEIEADEWRQFIEILWANQWTRKPVHLNEQLLQTMYFFSQGVIDIAIKIFASSQARAMLDGTEELTCELIADVYENELKLLHPMIEALRNDDIDALSGFDDIAPIGLDDILDDIKRKMQSKKSPLYTTKSSCPTYVSRIASGLIATGFEREEAISAAQNTIQPNKELTVIEGTKAALKSLTIPNKVTKIRNKKVDVDMNLDGRTFDYRHAIDAAQKNNSKIFEELRKLEYIKPLEMILDIE